MLGSRLKVDDASLRGAALPNVPPRAARTKSLAHIAPRSLASFFQSCIAFTFFAGHSSPLTWRVLDIMIRGLVAIIACAVVVVSMPQRFPRSLPLALSPLTQGPMGTEWVPAPQCGRPWPGASS